MGRLPIFNKKSKLERLEDSMEKDFKKAFVLLGDLNINDRYVINTKKMHEAYNLFFNCQKIYRYLKEERKMDLDDEELRATKRAKLQWALDTLEHRDEYIVMNSTLNEAIEVVVNFIKKLRLNYT